MHDSIQGRQGRARLGEAGISGFICLVVFSFMDYLIEGLEMEKIGGKEP